MCRGRDSLRRIVRLTTLFALITALASTSCIFGPEPIRRTQEDLTIRKPEDLITALQRVYKNRDYPGFEALLSGEAGAEYLFILNERTPEGETQWGRNEELRIHRRMFIPADTPDGDPPVPTELWLVDIQIDLTPQDAFAPADPSYYQPTNPDGLDPARWRASEAVYSTYVLFDTQGQLDYVVNNARADFVVIEDLTKEIGQPGKFLLYRWFDLGNPSGAKPASGPAA